MTIGPSRLNPNAIKNKTITSDKIVDGTIGSTSLADDAVTAAKLAAGAVGTTELASAAVTTAKIASSSITATELASNAVTTSKILDGNVTEAKLHSDVVAQLGGGSTILSIVTSTTAVQNTTTQTQVYSGTIAANTLGISEAIHLRAFGTYQNSNGADRTLELSFIYGGTGYLVGTIEAISSLGAARVWFLDVYIQCLNSSSTKALTAEFNMSDGSVSAATTGTGLFGLSMYYAHGFSTSVSKSNSSSQSLTIEVQHSNADSYFSINGATLIYIPS